MHINWNGRRIRILWSRSWTGSSVLWRLKTSINGLFLNCKLNCLYLGFCSTCGHFRAFQWRTERRYKVCILPQWPHRRSGALARAQSGEGETSAHGRRESPSKPALRPPCRQRQRRYWDQLCGWRYEMVTGQRRHWPHMPVRRTEHARDNNTTKQTQQNERQLQINKSVKFFLS